MLLILYDTVRFSNRNVRSGLDPHPNRTDPPSNALKENAARRSTLRAPPRLLLDPKPQEGHPVSVEGVGYRILEEVKKEVVLIDDDMEVDPPNATAAGEEVPLCVNTEVAGDDVQRSSSLSTDIPMPPVPMGIPPANEASFAHGIERGLFAVQTVPLATFVAVPNATQPPIIAVDGSSSPSPNIFVAIPKYLRRPPKISSSSSQNIFVVVPNHLHRRPKSSSSPSQIIFVAVPNATQPPIFAIDGSPKTHVLLIHPYFAMMLDPSSILSSFLLSDPSSTPLVSILPPSRVTPFGAAQLLSLLKQGLLTTKFN
ncbi:hypothetical protein BU17DRAFT_103915 [Hysterangium stoloniferum]|nr:hypothetical protein BU17DRAFT_103915 [Hysterangium stoloniferum]